MKFSKQLLYNSVAEWRQYYMNYADLKKVLSRLKKIAMKDVPSLGPSGDSASTAGGTKGSTQTLPDLRTLERTASAKVLLDLERNSLLDRSGNGSGGADGYMERSYDAAADDGFGEKDDHAEVERMFFDQLDREAQKVESLYIRMEGELAQLSASLVAHAINTRKRPPSQREETLATLRRRYVEHYLEITELLNFAELNRTGFEKILKKHDKVTNRSYKDDYMRTLGQHRFSRPTELESMRQEVEKEFARCHWEGDVEQATAELQESLRELVIWERNTIWRDMLMSERRVQGVTSKKAAKARKAMWFPVLKPGPFFLSVTMFLATLVLSHELFKLLPNIDEYTLDVTKAANRCLGLVVLVSFLWATEAVPLYVTALAIPLLSVLLKVFVTDDGDLFLPADAATLAISRMSSSVILLIIGGYSIAAALSKYALDKTVATLVLAKAGNPSQVVLLLMLLAVFLSMWISNVATPVLLNSVMLPILRGLPPASLPLVKCILLSIALASNIGGMGTPIASPQNAVALQVLHNMQHISFFTWLTVSLPLILLMVLSCHSLLIAWFSLPVIPTHAERLSSSHIVILGTIAVTVFLWCFKPALSVFGSDGMISCIPVISFYGLGILSKEDFNNLPWNVVYLVAGGVALGAAVESSMLLQIVGGAINHALRDSPLWLIYSVFCGFIFVVSSATSHTVSAIIIMPLLAEVGAGLGHPRLLVMGGALACSSAMALPVSSFPNAASVCVENELGKPYLQASDILKLGIQMTLIAAVILLTLGYLLMLLVRF